MCSVTCFYSLWQTVCPHIVKYLMYIFPQLDGFVCVRVHLVKQPCDFYWSLILKPCVFAFELKDSSHGCPVDVFSGRMGAAKIPLKFL